jgi:FMN phosphatase YigB (HAD superfamily)
MSTTYNIDLPQDIKLVVFDLDGTLYQKRGLACRMFFNAAKDWKLMLAERKTRRALRGKWHQSEVAFYNLYFHTMAGFCDLPASELRTWYFNRYMPLMVDIIRKFHRPTEWLDDFINVCKKKSVQLVVLSDYGHVAEKLEALGIDKKLFDWVISAPELGGLKPAPQLLLQILEKMKVTPKQCLVIGDREDTDGQLAQSVGALFQLV